MIYYFFYRRFMRLAHRYNWHHAKVMPKIDTEPGTMRWCQWCGLRGRVISAEECLQVIRAAKSRPAASQKGEEGK